MKHIILKLAWISLCLFGFAIELFSQDPDPVTGGTGPSSFTDPAFNAIPTDPQAAGLSRFIESPTSLFSGTPSISIPIYTIQLKQLTVPISIDYHSSGIRVDELASDVGLGWTLNAGGVITQTINDSDDLFDMISYPTNLSSFDGTFLSLNDPDHQYAILASESNAASGIDSEPDLFYYNFLGKSGMFVESYGGDKVFDPIPLQPILISWTDSNPGFKIIDENGIIYLFQNGSSTENRKQPVLGLGQGVDNSSSWYLTKIITPYGEVVEFNYETYVYDYVSSVFEWYTVRTNADLSCPFKEPKKGVTESHVIGKRLTSIVTSGIGGERGVSVDFQYDENYRLDIGSEVQGARNESKALKKIVVKNAYESIKEFSLDHTYFGCDGNEEATYEQSLACRLKLVSVTESGKPPYYFDYYEDQGSPKRLSNAQDIYGYYNGATTNRTLIPDGTLTSDELNSISSLTTLANRDVDLEKIKAFMLKDYVYPTGGYTRFDYEAKHRVVQEEVFEEQSQVFNLFSQASRPEPVIVEEFEETFHLDVPTGYDRYTFTAGFDLINPAPEGDPDPLPVFEWVDVELEFVDSGTKYTASKDDVSAFFNHIPSGAYHLKVRNYHPDIYQVAWSINGYRNEEISTTVSHYKADGGVRVSEITHYDSDGELLLSRLFDYEDPTTRLPPKFDRKFTENLFDCAIGVSTACKYKQVTATSSPSLWGIAYNPEVGYKKVTVKEHSSTLGDLITEHQFHTNISDIDPSRIHTGLPIDLSWVRGLPYKTIYKVKDGETYDTLKEETYDYYVSPESAYFVFESDPESLDQNERHIPGLRVELEEYRYSCVIGLDLTANPFTFDVDQYKLVSLWYYQSGKKTRSYENGQLLESSETYFYDPTYKQLSKTLFTNSKGEVIETRYTRPHDYTASPYTAMTAANMLTPIIETKVTNLTEDKVLASTITAYKSYGFFKLPSKQYELAIDPEIGINGSQGPGSGVQVVWDANFRPIKEYTYDNYGNVNHIIPFEALTSTHSTKVIWGYDRNHVLAVVENPDEGDIAYSGFEDPSLGGWQEQEITNEVSCRNQLNACLSTPSSFEAYLDCQSEYLDCLANPDADILNVTRRQEAGYTGEWSFRGELQKTVIHAGMYEVSLWAKGSAPITVNGVAQAPEITEWKLLRWTLDLNTNDPVSIHTGSSRIDDVRLHLKGAQMTSYTWSPGEGMTSKMDPNHQVISYAYDETGRLIEVKDQDQYFLNEYEYIYND